MRQLVFLVEDDPVVRRGCEQALALAGLRVRSLANAEIAIEALRSEPPCALVTDVRLPGRDGLELMQDVRLHDSDIPVILVTGHGDVSMAVSAMRQGAYDFIEKPFSSERLVEVVRRALERRRLVLENREGSDLAPETGLASIAGQSSAIDRVRRRVQMVARTDVDVLISGETGTGKEVVARAIHAVSGRRGPFVALNCGALQENLVESEIFGHEAGAFTGAVRRRVGKIEHADGGTLFLDEIESMSPAVQVKLLRVLQEREIERLGSNEVVPVHCRVVAAVKEDLKKLAEHGRFRADLYYRLNVVTIEIPPLRHRPDDVALLMARFVKEAAVRYKVTPREWTDQEMLQWQQHEWPGNVRELRNVAERFCLGAIEARELPVAAVSLASRLEIVERSLINDALRVAEGNVARGADLLQIPRKTLYDKLQRFGMPANRLTGKRSPAAKTGSTPLDDPADAESG